MWDDETRMKIAAVVVNRWPFPSGRSWDPSVLEGYLREIEHDDLPPDLIVRGLRLSTSNFPPSVGGVRALVWQAAGPMTGADVAAAQERLDGRAAGAVDGRADGPRELPAGSNGGVSASR